jgi:hypothetical protein
VIGSVCGTADEPPPPISVVKPQQYTWPLPVIAQLCRLPAKMSMAAPMPSTSTGTLLSVNDPLPS